jgi:hypothetical protein
MRTIQNAVPDDGMAIPKVSAPGDDGVKKVRGGWL